MTRQNKYLDKKNGGNDMEFMELKREKERGMTNEKFFDETKNALIESEAIVIIGLSGTRIVTSYVTSNSQLITLGLMDIAKSQIIADTEA